MQTELKYFITAYVPLKVSDKDMREACFTSSVTIDPTALSNVYKFFGYSEKDLRFVITRLNLIIID